MKTTTPPVRNSMSHSFGDCRPVAGLLIPLVLACFVLLPRARAVVPAPDGGYPNWNTAEGTNALFRLTNGIYNTALGGQALYSITGGSYNTAVGLNALYSNNGWYNTANGFEALFHNTNGTQNTATGVNALYSNTMGNYNTANGVNALYRNTTADDNTATGFHALFNNDGYENTACGSQALSSNTDGGGNTAVGAKTLMNNSGYNNTAIGVDALLNNTSGSSNIALGNGAASFVSTASNVICIGANGENVDSSCYIGSIFGQTASGGTAVFINSDGQLGTASSSRRFKKEIKPMESASEAILALKPVTFHYKSDKTGTAQFGLIAEEVAEVNPDLVIRDKNGEIYTVRYDAVNAMLLNEFLKEHKAFLEEHRNVEKLEATVSRQQKQIEALAAGLERVSSQLEVKRPCVQIVDNSE